MINQPARIVWFLTITCTLIFAVGSSAQDSAETTDFPTLIGPYLGQEPPGIEPALFAEGIIAVDDIEHCFPTFNSDGTEVFWMTIKRGSRPKIMHMEMRDGVWTAPGIAPFSGEFSDQAPVYSLDGNRLYFASNRPGGFGGSDIWYVEKTDSGWTEPVNLGSPPNSEDGETQPTFTNGGSVYFVGKMDSVQWERGIYRSRLIDGKYAEREALLYPINTEYADAYPFIAPDESYLIFASTRPGGNSVETDLYISFINDDGTFGEPQHMDESINNGKSVGFPYVTLDGKYLFFGRFIDSGTDAFFWVDGKVIDKYRPNR
ncbi:MAG: hypothetical protein AB1483_00580 [Candidatus Zixiibacteriota bacterium]